MVLPQHGGRIVPEDVYRKLAQRLDEIPNGFPATESGVELRLLAKIFAPEEAALASIMSLHRESADKITSRAGKDPRATYRTLKTMARRGQIRFGRKEGQLAFERATELLERAKAWGVRDCICRVQQTSSARAATGPWITAWSLRRLRSSSMAAR
jgi:hypothetical protein